MSHLHFPRLIRRTKASSERPQVAPALPPGSLIHIGEQRTDNLTIHVVEYDREKVRTAEAAEVSECLDFKNTPPVTWMRVVGLHEVEKVGELGRAFDVHPLLLEDILNTKSRSKVEVADDHVFVVSKLVAANVDEGRLEVQHFAMLLLPNTVITFQEEPSGIFDPVVERIMTGGGGRIRNAGPDYLAWAVLDAVVDNYFGVIDSLDDVVSHLDDQLQENAAGVEGAHLYATRKEVTGFHRMVRPLREMGNALQRAESKLMTEYSAPFYRDLYDHTIQAIERTEDLRDLTSGLRDFYLSAVSNRMNEIMKVLTCFATIFLPLTFFAGIYGMNFESMPELKWAWAYPALWVVFVLTAAGMFVYFRKKRWL